MGADLHEERRVSRSPDAREMRMTIRHKTDAAGGRIHLKVEGVLNSGHVSGQSEATAGLAWCPLWQVRCVAAFFWQLCAPPWQPAREAPSHLDDEVSPVMLDDPIHTPVAIGPQGCVLCSIEMPGDQAPTALVQK